MPTPCPACAAAEQRAAALAFVSGCMGCLTRALAESGAHIESAAAGRMTPRYRGALDVLFGDGWQQGHDLVKAWARIIGRPR